MIKFTIKAELLDPIYYFVQLRIVVVFFPFFWAEHIDLWREIAVLRILMPFDFST